MSESFSILPLRAEVREWLVGEGYAELPVIDGRQATFDELKNAIAALPELAVEWSENPNFPDAWLKAANGQHAQLIIGSIADDGVCDFHLRDGHGALIESVANSLSSFVGPLVIHAHSGSFTNVVYQFGCGT
jgi:hypothetical protein